MAFNVGNTSSATAASPFNFQSSTTFGGSSTPLAKTSSTPLFGAQTSSGTSTPGLFGTTNTAASSGSSLFGGSTGSTFSMSNTQPFAFSGSSAGQTTTGTSTPGLFGTPPASSGSSLFGGASGSAFATFNTQPSTSFGATGQSTSSFSFSAPASGASQMGGTALVPFGMTGQTQTMTLPVASQPDVSAIRELQSIRESYVASPGNPRYKFQYLFLNVVKDSNTRQKPSDVDELQWREALRRAGGPNNPHSLWPVPYYGFKGLLERKKSQTEAIKEHKERLETLQKNVAALANRHETVVKVQMEAIKSRQQQLSQQLLSTLRHIDALEGRFSRAVGYDTTTPKDLLHKLDHDVREMETVISSHSAHGLMGRVDAVASAARVQAITSGSRDSDSSPVDDLSLSQIYTILKDYSDAISKMQDALHRNARDVAVLTKLQQDGK